MQNRFLAVVCGALVGFPATAGELSLEPIRTVRSVELTLPSAPEIAGGVGDGVVVETPVVVDAAAELADAVEIRRELLSLVRDRRALLGVGVQPDDPLWQRWIDIYRSPEYANYVAEYKPLEPGLRIITEVRCPTSDVEFQTLCERLSYYAGRGYNAVLVTFDTTENLPRLSAAVDYIKTAGFRVVVAYAGREHLSEPVFRDPDVLRRWLSTLGCKANALLLGWRRTSLHWFLPDRAFTNFLIRSAREGNPDLPFVGMAYYGETAETRQGVTYDVPENCSAVLVVGLGYPRASTRRALRQLFPEVANHPHLIGLAVGERPYFYTRGANVRSRAENEALQRRIEIRLLQAGCGSTLTYSGDGGEGRGGVVANTDNLCRPAEEFNQ